MTLRKTVSGSQLLASFSFILVGGLWAWGNDSSTKKKQVELDTANARIVALEKQQEEQSLEQEHVKSLEVKRVASLALCLMTADSNRDENLKMNGHYNPKTNRITAPIYAFQVAENQRANDISQCHIQYGGNQ